MICQTDKHFLLSGGYGTSGGGRFFLIYGHGHGTGYGNTGRTFADSRSPGGGALSGEAMCCGDSPGAHEHQVVYHAPKVLVEVG